MLPIIYQSRTFCQYSTHSKFLEIIRRYCEQKKDISEEKDDIKLPDPPTTCCMSACPNCVWIEYANELNSIFRDGGGKSAQIIQEKITDPNMKAFLLMELKILNSKKS